MPNIFAILHGYVDFFPLFALIGLILGGFNLPISEDLVIITGALVSQGKPENLFINLTAIYVGVVATDFIMYWIGGRVRSGAAKTGVFARMVPEKALNKMHHSLDKYGILTFIVCRLIPFGVRNTLFFTAGFFRLRARVFALYDCIAAMISVNLLFFLVYYFGEDVKRPIRIAGVVLFVFVVSGFIALVVRFILRLRGRKSPDENGENRPADD